MPNSVSWPRLPVLDDARGPRQHAVDFGEHRRARFAEAIARAGFDQRLQHFAVDRAAIDPLAKVGKRIEFPALPRRQNALDRDLARRP